MTGLTTYIGYIGDVFEAGLGWLGDCVEIFTTQPVLFVPVALAIFAIMINRVASLVKGA